MFDKIIVTAALATTLAAAGDVQAQSDTGTIVLEPGVTFSAAADLQTPHAWTFPGDPDLWTFDLSAASFASGALVGLTIEDNYPAVPDAYKVYWDGTPLGTTTSGSLTSFSVAAAQGKHELKVEWFTSFGATPTAKDGSYYNLNVVAQVPEPQTAALTLLGLALLGVYARRRRGA